jgi:hypothetical protein
MDVVDADFAIVDQGLDGMAPEGDIGERLARLESQSDAAKQAVDYALTSLDKRLEARDKAHEEAHRIEREVADRERESMSFRLAGMNEFRQQLNDQTKTFATSDSLQSKIDQLDQRMSQNREDTLSRIGTLERTFNARNELISQQLAQSKGSDDLIRWAVPLVITIVVVAVGFLLR